ncbi:MAG TPA: glycosyltransferase family 39 protein [Verrucomicrobiae bacterium]|nr:glycosyltransferase family 39 protein [Verrucomicrobiae bacterium]
MRVHRYTLLALLFLLVAVTVLMVGVMRQESATIDEPVFLGSGWTYWQGYRYRFNPEHPPLTQLLAALPLTLLDVKLTRQDSEVLTGKIEADPVARWDVRVGPRTVEVFPHGPGFYQYPFDEQSYFGEKLVYGGQNNGEKLLFWGRIPEVVLTLLTGLMVFLWARQLQGELAGLLAASMFLLNPVVLAYGHIVQSDIGITLAFPLTVWMFARLLEAPSIGRAVVAGLIAGLALATKYTGIILIPTGFVLWLLFRWRGRGPQMLGWKHALLVGGIAWVVVMLFYVPHCSPPPPIDRKTASELVVPIWFLSLRPILIPADYFKGLALTLLHASGGHEAYLNGKWSESGWWYYFPLAFAMKTPLAFWLFLGAGVALAIRFRGELPFEELAVWAGAFIYLLCVMQSRADIGVRHLLPLYPLLSIGSAGALLRWKKQSVKVNQRLADCAVASLPIASLVIVAFAYPWFLCYMNPLAGGIKNGYRHLLDSNYDWGQNVKRLKQFLDERGIQKVYLQFFGAQEAIDYYRIANEAVDGESAKQIQRGWLVVSVQMLMRPEWRWLRDSRQPVARVGYTLFVYQFGKAEKAAD